MALPPELARARLALLPPRPIERDASEPEWWVRSSALWLARRSSTPLFTGTDHDELIAILDPLLRRAHRELERNLAKHGAHLANAGAIAKSAIVGAMSAIAAICREVHLVPEERLFERHPVLGFQLIERLDQWTQAAAEAVERTVRALPEIAKVFGTSANRIESIALGFGAPHANGRTVARVELSDGTTLALKPRSVAAEAALQQAIAWLGARASTSFRTLAVLDLRTHGFVEWVEHEHRTSPQIQHRRGALLALSHALLLTGLEKNIVVSGEHPLLIDAETIDPAREPIRVVEQTDPDLIAGFENAYRIMTGESQRFIADVVDPFSRTPRRLVVRPTETYLELLSAAQRPELLESAAERELHFNRLWRSIGDRPELFPFVPAEIAALMRGDVPRFESSNGVISEPASGPVEVRAEDDVTVSRARVRRLGDADLRRQRWLIEAVSDPSSGSLVDAAHRVGTRLLIRLDSAISADSISSDLYDGFPGLALVMAELARATGEAYFQKAASSLIRSTEIAVHRRDISALGGFCGWSGLTYALVRFDVLEESRQRLPLVRICAERAYASLPREALDLISGAAGTIVVLLRAFSLYREESFLDLASKLGDRLVAAAKDTIDGLRWPAESCLGFGCGSSGIAWALDRLARATNDPRHRSTAQRGLRFVRSLFDPDRTEPGWCRGAAGIALALLESRDDRLLAVAHRIVSSSDGGCSLCHGEMGNLEIAHRIAEAFGDRALVEKVERAARAIAGRADRSALGLMNGLGGVAYGLLRLAVPSVPSVLSLEGPETEPAYARPQPPELPAVSPPSTFAESVGCRSR